MSVALPTAPRGTKWTPRFMRYGGDLTPVLGGPVQRIGRLGTRFSYQVDLPPMSKAIAAAWIAAIAQADATNDTLRLVVPQLTDGSAVTGRTAVSGVGAGLVISSGAGVAVGQLFSFVVAGHSYLHLVTSVSGSNLGVSPLLRVNPAGVALEFNSPAVDGFAPDGANWTLEMLRFVGVSFAVNEDR